MSQEPDKVIYSMMRVGKVHGTKQVLKDISLSYFYGAKIGVLGLNGSGKSTLLKIMAGVDTEILGETACSPGFSIGYLEQEPLVDEDKTVLEVVQEDLSEALHEADAILLALGLFQPLLQELRKGLPATELGIDLLQPGPDSVGLGVDVYVLLQILDALLRALQSIQRYMGQLLQEPLAVGLPGSLEQGLEDAVELLGHAPASVDLGEGAQGLPVLGIKLQDRLEGPGGLALVAQPPGVELRQLAKECPLLVGVIHVISESLQDLGQRAPATRLPVALRQEAQGLDVAGVHLHQTLQGG